MLLLGVFWSSSGFRNLAFTETAGKRCADGDGGSAIAGNELLL